MNVFCISIDGLHCGMIGAYGNTWIQTPTLDALACQSVLFDRFYTETLELTAIFDSIWQLNQRKDRMILLTDDDEIFLHAKANEFDKRYRLKPFRDRQPVQTLEETQFFNSFAAALDLFLEQKRSVKSCFLWAHFQGFRGRWDFPIQYREMYQADEDPAPYPGVELPRVFLPNTPNTPNTPNVNLPNKMNTEIDPDKIQSVMETYAGGVTVLDQALAGLLDSFEEGELGNETLFLFVSTRGFSLGEHGRIGADDNLYGENLQLPLFVRFPDGFGASVRVPALFRSDDLASFLNNLSDNDSPVFNLVREKTEMIHETLRITGKSGSVLVTPDWFFRKMLDGRSELYVKPDDRWEANDVADRCPEIVEELVRYFEV
ncbi:MAG: sulfatase-like hydrolase/transferase [Planctomycetaceae bacterium]|jgi:arylsulfatase A-like enzyme|nr:sulfatase-like hydrolase/transferase [Planctomycetaceae bacterium]